jgi:hypothetical protein
VIGEEEGADALRGYSSESKTGQSDAGDFDLDPWVFSAAFSDS